MDVGLTLKYANPKEIGSDRIVNAAAAYQKYRPTSSSWISARPRLSVPSTETGEYLGGVIAPGVGISAEALFARAAKLSKVELARPKTVIGTDTASSIQAGLLFGYAGLVDTLVRAHGTGNRTNMHSHRHRWSGLSRSRRRRDRFNIEPFLTLQGLNSSTVVPAARV